FQAEDGIRDGHVTGVQTCALPISIADLAAQLETVPRKKLEYKGTTFEEMDVDAVLARRPQVVLVDELAHTNIPGSKHRKRYEDEIGRASCRERVEMSVGAETGKGA